MPWLANDFINLVNKPQYRKRAEVQVTDANLALSYIGLDNLRMLVPTFLIKHWLPQNTSPFPLLKRKIWNDALSIAIVAQTLAKARQVNPSTAYTAGMLCNIGIITVIRSVFDIYTQELKQSLLKAYQDRDKRLYEVLLELRMGPELLLEHFVKYNSTITAEIIELMRFENMPITEPAFELADQENVEHMSPIACIVIQAISFVAVRNLAKETLITEEESQLWMDSVKLTKADINLLKRTDIDHLKLNFK